MKIAAIIAGILLGGLFIMSASVVLFNLAPMPEIPKDTPPYYFMAAVGPTGYMTMVKIVELLGGLMVLIPKTRNIGLLFLGPVIVNILAYHQFVQKDGILQPALLGIVALSLFLLWVERARWKALVA
ncbi:MAG: hypothetical protein V4662_22245 [Verrucomicrobiota bacterium]